MRRAAFGLAVLLACVAFAQADERLEKLAGGLRSEDSNARMAAYNALNRERSAALPGILLKVLPDCSDIGQYYGILVLQRQPPKAARAALRKLTSSSSVHLRVTAAAYLWRMGDTKTASVIVQGLRDATLPAARKALLLLRVYGIRDDGVLAAVREHLTPDAAPAVLDAALYNVYMARDKGAGSAVKSLAAHADPSVRALAGACLLVLGDAAAAEGLAEALGGGGMNAARMQKLRSMLNAVKPVPESVLAALLGRLEEEQDINVLRPIVELLGEAGYAKAAGAIRKLVDHANSLLSKAAFTALTRFPGAVTPESMRELLQSEKDAPRLAAAEALRRADDASGLPVVLGILKDGKVDSDRWEAARVLAGFRTAQVVQPLLAALMDKHTTVRANAYNSLGVVLRSLFPYRRFDLNATDYATTGTAAARQAAVAKLRAWWQANKDRDW